MITRGSKLLDKKTNKNVGQIELALSDGQDGVVFITTRSSLQENEVVSIVTKIEERVDYHLARRRNYLIESSNRSLGLVDVFDAEGLELSTDLVARPISMTEVTSLAGSVINLSLHDGKYQQIAIRSVSESVRALSRDGKENRIYGGLISMASSVDGQTVFPEAKSGQLIFTEDKRALGLVVGAAGNCLLLAPLSEVIDQAELFDLSDEELSKHNELVALSNETEKIRSAIESFNTENVAMGPTSEHEIFGWLQSCFLKRGLGEGASAFMPFEKYFLDGRNLDIQLMRLFQDEFPKFGGTEKVLRRWLLDAIEFGPIVAGQSYDLTPVHELDGQGLLAIIIAKEEAV